MMYSSLTITGFGPHATTQHYDFTPGTVLITGGNGTGKTTIIDAIAWAMHGNRATLKSVKDKESIINEKSQTAKVVLVLEHDGNNVTVTRTRTRSGKHLLSLIVNDKPQDLGVTASQELLNEICGGVNSEVFTTVATLSSSPSLPTSVFISQSDTDRRAFLSEIVDPEREFENANKVIRVRLRDEKKTLTRLEGRIQGLEESMPEEPDLERLTEVGKEIEDCTRERKRLEQKMSAARSRDDVQIAGLISTHKSELDSLSSRVAELTLKKERLLTELENNYSDIDDLEEGMTETYQELRVARVKEDSLKHEKIGLTDRVEFFERSVDEIRNRRDIVRSEKMALDHLLSLAGEDDDVCSLCGSPMTDHSYEHIHQMDRRVVELGRIISEYDTTVSDHREMIRVLRDYILDVQDSLTAVNPKKLSMEVDNIIAEVERINQDQKALMNSIEVVERDIRELEQRCQHHSYMIDSLTEQADPEVLLEHDAMDGSWEFIADQLAELMSEQSRIEDLVIHFEDYQHKVRAVEDEMHRTRKIINQLNILKEQTSPTGVISVWIADLAREISDRATDLVLDTFDRGVVVDILTSVEDGDNTCRVNVDGRDISTHSHGEQARFITAILVALSEVFEEKTSCWIPLLWDEPTMATDIGITPEFLSMVSDGDSRQVFLATRDDFPDDCMDQIIDTGV